MTLIDLIHSPHLRMLSRERAEDLDAAEAKRLRAKGFIMPIGGAEGDGSGDGGDGGAGSGDGDGGDGAGDGGDGGDGGSGDGSDGDGDGSGDGGSDDHDDDDDLKAQVATARAEAAAATRRAAEAEKARRTAERKLQAKATADAEAEGEFQQLYETEKEKNDSLVGSFKDSVLKRTIVEVASRLNFRNPAVAGSLVDLDSSDIVDDDFDSDEKAVETALKLLAKKEPYLVKPDRGQADGGRSGSGGNGNGARSQGQSGGAADDEGKQVYGPTRLRRVERSVG